ncbi:MAG: UbiA family prenyltransferase [Litoreibacter sp.]|uniref:UbiA family prenyltransferase n=1 Tax=Litoreibacter sp. TaxID=1969459 RepID=UPI003298E9F2
MTKANSKPEPTDPAASASDTNVPLIVDLDGTLTSSDTLHEALLRLIARDPARLFKVVTWLKDGKAAFKANVVNETDLDITVLPFRQEVLDLIERARADGRQVFLVSASHQKQVDEVANHLCKFDEAVGSDGVRNLGGTAKAEWLVDRFGAQGFDYVGDSAADLKVWPNAREAICVGATASVRSKLAASHTNITELDSALFPSATFQVYLKGMRPHQWLKNLLVFVPMLAAHNFSAFWPTLFAFLSFCMAASSIYMINDMLDLEIDRRHPRKCKRPFASGAIPVKSGVILSLALLIAALALGLFAQLAFLLVLAGYVLLTFAYSLVLKRKLMIDIWTLGALYTIRIIAGGAATGIPLSEWLLAFSMFVFLSLAAVKRQSELADLKRRGLEESDGRGYRVSDLPILLGVVLSAGYCSVLILALYVSSATSTGLYSEPRLFWLVCPLLLYWISRATIISYRGEMDDDPIVFALKDRVSQVVFGLATLLIILSANI